MDEDTGSLSPAADLQENPSIEPFRGDLPGRNIRVSSEEIEIKSASFYFSQCLPQTAMDRMFDATAKQAESECGHQPGDRASFKPITKASFLGFIVLLVAFWSPEAACNT